jgi:SAM-dependent methyltransferase
MVIEQKMQVACRGCGSRQVQTFLDLGEQPHCNRLVPASNAGQPEARYPLRVGFCTTCTLVQIDHTIPKESMFSDYPYVSGTTRTLVEHFRESAERLADTYHLTSADLVVDIGSNDGTWLRQYQPLGVRVLGVDPAANVVALARAAGVPSLDRFFNEETAAEIVATHGHARLITAAGVFFHLEELHGVIRGIRHLLAEDGTFVVQAIYLGGMIDNTAFDQVYHEHLVYYTLRSLEHLLGLHGLQVVEARLVPIHGGTLEAHVVRAGSRPTGPSVAAMREAEASRGYGELATYQAFADRVWDLGRRLVALLESYRDAGRTVYAFGAPAKGATLLNSYGIGPNLVARATERNPLKVGWLMPGSQIPIIDEAGTPPDAFLVLAWNFIDEFVAREHAYLNAGGEFIVPIPDLRVIRAGAS